MANKIDEIGTKTNDLEAKVNVHQEFIELM